MRVHCTLCAPSQKTLWSARNTTSNFKKHLDTVHKATKLVGKEPAKETEKRSRGGAEDDDGPPGAKQQCTLLNKPAISPMKFRSLMSEYIVEDMLPLSTADSPSFRKLLLFPKLFRHIRRGPIHVYTDKESKTLKWRDLISPETIKLLNKIQLNASFSNIPHVDKIQTIWVEFKEIYKILQSNDPDTDDQLINLKSHLNKWILLFLSVYQAKHVTPYIHILVSHIPEFLSLYGPISPFSQQGLEKFNDDITKDYFRSMNHRDGEALKLLFKLNRLEEPGVRHLLKSCTRFRNQLDFN